MREAQKCIYAEKLTQLPRPRFFPTHFCTFIALLHLIVNNRNNSSKKRHISLYGHEISHFKV